MARRQHNPRQAKSLRYYTVKEIARLYGCHKNTVRHWLARGLQMIDGRRPIVVRGDALNAFHAARRSSAKRPCGIGEIYCLSCRAPKRPAGDLVEHRAMPTGPGKLSAICPDCDRMIFQRVNARRLEAFRGSMTVFDVKP